MIKRYIPSILDTRNIKPFKFNQYKIISFLNEILKDSTNIQSIIISRFNTFYDLINGIIKCSTLKHVALKNMRYKNYFMYKNDGFFEDLRKNPSIQSIEIDNMLHKSSEMKRIKALISNNMNLKELSILECKIHQEGFIFLQDALKSNTILKCLNLHRFGTVKDSIDIIDDIIRSNTNLETLSLSSCEMDDEDFLKLLVAVQFNKKLKILNLSGNKMTDNSLKLLFFHSLQFNDCLKDIILKKCKFTTEGIVSIINKTSSFENSLKSIDFLTYVFLENGHTKVTFFD